MSQASSSPNSPSPESQQQDRDPAPLQPDVPRGRVRAWLWSLLRIAGLSYACLLLVLVLLENRMLFPAAYFEHRPIRGQRPSQPWEYLSKEGRNVTGRIVRRPGSRRAILYLHGNGVLAEQLDQWLWELSQRCDATVLAAEYSGYQHGDVSPNESNLIADSVAALNALSDDMKLDRNEIIVYGRSIGGGCATGVASQCGTRTLVLERTFDSVVDVAAEKFPYFPVRLLMRNRFDSVARMASFNGKLIQIHGTSDQLIPIDHGRRLFESVPADDKVFLTVESLGHNDQLPTSTLGEIARLLGPAARVDTTFRAQPTAASADSQ